MCRCTHVMEEHEETGRPIPYDYGACDICSCMRFVMMEERD